MAGQPHPSLSAFGCMYQEVDLQTVSSLGVFFSLVGLLGFFLSLYSLHQEKFSESQLSSIADVLPSQQVPDFQNYLPALCLDLLAVGPPAILWHFFCLVPFCQLSLSQRCNRNIPGTMLCEEHTQRIPPLRVLRWEEMSVSLPQGEDKAPDTGRQHNLVLAEQGEEGADNALAAPLELLPAHPDGQNSTKPWQP